MAKMRSVPSTGWPAAVASFALVVVLGLFYLPYPLGTDNALFLLYAKGLAEGARLYVDLWDVKQPGIYWFFLLAGTLFGFSAIAVRLLELIWLLLAALVMWHTARRCFHANNSAIPLVPLLTTGLYYASAKLSFFAMVEILVSLPLAGCLLAGVLAAKNRAFRWWWGALFGFCAALVATFKLLLIVVPSAMGLALIALTWDRTKGFLQPVIVRFVLPAVVGLVIPLGLIAFYFYSLGNWDAFFWTQFVYPPLALLQVEGRPFGRLVDVGGWIAAAFLPAAFVIGLAVRGVRDRPPRTDEVLALVWLIAGLVPILLQKNSFLAYHFLLLLFPSGYLVCSAINRVQDSSKSRYRIGVVVATVVLMFLMAGIKQIPDKWSAVAAAWHASRGEALDQFRDLLRPGYIEARTVVAELREQAPPSASFFVFGDSSWLLMANAPQELPISGSIIRILLPEQRREFVQGFKEKKPMFIFIDDPRRGYIERDYPELQAFLRQNYGTRIATHDGVWYELKR